MTILEIDYQKYFFCHSMILSTLYSVTLGATSFIYELICNYLESSASENSNNCVLCFAQMQQSTLYICSTSNILRIQNKKKLISLFRNFTVLLV